MTKGNDLAHPTNIIDPEGQFAPEYHTGLIGQVLKTLLVVLLKQQTH